MEMQSESEEPCPLSSSRKQAPHIEAGSAQPRQLPWPLGCSKRASCIQETLFSKSSHLPIPASSFPPTFSQSASAPSTCRCLEILKVSGHPLPYMTRYPSSPCRSCASRERVDTSATSCISIPVGHPVPEMRHSSGSRELRAVAAFKQAPRRHVSLIHASAECLEPSRLCRHSLAQGPFRD